MISFRSPQVISICKLGKNYHTGKYLAWHSHLKFEIPFDLWVFGTNELISNINLRLPSLEGLFNEGASRKLLYHSNSTEV